MRLIVDTEAGTITRLEAPYEQTFALFSPEGFEALSHLWVQVGWDQRYPYTFSWLGQPIIQLPEDMIRLQELVWQLQPDVIIETGVAHGGSLLFLSTLCRAMDKGRVIGVDIEIRPHNRAAIEAHPLSDRIQLVEGDSISEAIVRQVHEQVAPDERVLVVLDSNHSRDHVRGELEAYAPLLRPGDFIVATDGVMKHLTEVPRGSADWDWNNPEQAATEFLEDHPEFERVDPPRVFDESASLTTPTHWPGAWLRRRAA